MTVYIVKTESTVLEIFDNEAEANLYSSRVGSTTVVRMETKSKCDVDDLKVLAVVSDIYWNNRYSVKPYLCVLEHKGHKCAKTKRAFCYIHEVFVHKEGDKPLCLSIDLIVPTDKIPQDWEKKCMTLHSQYEKIANDIYETRDKTKNTDDETKKKIKDVIETELEEIIFRW